VSKDQAFFKQVIVANPETWSMMLYNQKGVLISEEQFSDYDLTKMFGEQKYFYPNGQLKQIKTFNKSEKLEGKYELLSETGIKKIQGNYQNVEKEGVWEHYYKNGNKLARITYAKGNVVDHKLWTETGEEKDEPLILEQMPQFKNGQKDWNKYIKQNLTPKLKKGKYQGRVLIQFTIDTDGRPIGIKILPKKVNDRVRSAILSFFGSMPNWKPAIQLNRPVKMKMALPLLID
jgi:hypothetical protein